MTDGDWRAKFREGMNAVAPPGKHVREEHVREWARSTTKFHKDLPLSYRVRLVHHLNMIDRYERLIRKHGMKAARAGQGEVDHRTAYHVGSYHYRLADEYRLLAAKHALKVVHIEDRLKKMKEGPVKTFVFGE
jgi:hypothetical protein